MRGGLNILIFRLLNYINLRYFCDTLTYTADYRSRPSQRCQTRRPTRHILYGVQLTVWRVDWLPLWLHVLDCIKWVTAIIFFTKSLTARESQYSHNHAGTTITFVYIYWTKEMNICQYSWTHLNSFIGTCTADYLTLWQVSQWTASCLIPRKSAAWQRCNRPMNG